MKADLDRCAGVLLGLAAGDALGAGYEFTTPGPGAQVEMRGGGGPGWAPGEWTDDTAQAVGIAEILATGTWDSEAIGQRFIDWASGPVKDIGISTSAVMRMAGGDPAALPSAAASYFASHPKGAAGNGSLMRTGAVALSALGDDAEIARRAREVSLLTHGDPLAADACVLWCIAIDRAVREGRLDGVHDGLALLSPGEATRWADLLRDAETGDPFSFTPNGFVVPALQAAHAVITQTPVPADEPSRHLQDTLEQAVRIGHDTDTVAAIAGQVLGARWGSTAVPWRWRRLLHGWPAGDAELLVRLAVLTARRGQADGTGWPSAPSLVPWGRAKEPAALCAPLDGDDDLLVGNLPGLAIALDEGVDAVVSLCRVGADETPPEVEHHRFRLVDAEGANAHPAVVLKDAAQAVRTLRKEGKRVYLHCVGGRSRTAAVASLVLADRLGGRPTDHLARIRPALPESHFDVFGPVLESIADDAA